MTDDPDWRFDHGDIPNWNVEETNDDGNPIGWRNDETYTFIGLLYNEDIEKWEVRGENSRVNTAETCEEARKKAIEFMYDTPKPSPMI